MDVMFSVLPSEYVPLAVKCCVSPSAMIGFIGATSIDTSVADVPFKVLAIPFTHVAFMFPAVSTVLVPIS